MTAQPSEQELFAPLAAVVGRNCRRLRKTIGLTQDDLARHVRSVGLDWTETRVGHFEAGRSAPTFATALVVTLAFELARQEAVDKHPVLAEMSVTLADLLGNKGFVELTDRLKVVPVPLIAAVCRGEPFGWPPADEYWVSARPDVEVEPGVQQRRTTRTAALVKKAQAQMATSLALDLRERAGLTEQRIAKELDIDPGRLASVSFRLWKGTFSEERDRRAGAESSPQKRGRISRELRAELEEALTHGNS